MGFNDESLLELLKTLVDDKNSSAQHLKQLIKFLIKEEKEELIGYLKNLTGDRNLTENMRPALLNEVKKYICLHEKVLEEDILKKAGFEDKDIDEVRTLCNKPLIKD